MHTIVFYLFHCKIMSLKYPFSEHLDKMMFTVLSSNPNAVHLLEQNLDKVDWVELSQNPNAIPILEQNLDRVY